MQCLQRIWASCFDQFVPFKHFHLGEWAAGMCADVLDQGVILLMWDHKSTGRSDGDYLKTLVRFQKINCLSITGGQADGMQPTSGYVAWRFILLRTGFMRMLCNTLVLQLCQMSERKSFCFWISNEKKWHPWNWSHNSGRSSFTCKFE